MINRPFPIRCIHVETPGKLMIRINFSEHYKTTQDLITEIDSVFSSAERFGCVGGFSGNLISPLNSSLLLKKIINDSGMVIEWRFQTLNVDPGLILFVINILHRISLDYNKITQITIISSFLDARANIPKPSHTYFKPLPFHFVNLMESRRVVLTINFFDVQPESTRNAFIEIWKDWVILAQTGAFSEDEHDLTKGTVLIVEAPQSLPEGMIFFHERARISNSGFHCLINALHFMHFKVAKLDEVVLS